MVVFLSGEEHPFPCLSQLLETSHIAWLVGRFHLQSQQGLVESVSRLVTLTPHLLPLPSSSTFKDLCDYTGSTQIIQDSLFMVRSHD